MVSVSSQRQAARYLQHHYPASERQVCQAIRLSRSTLRYQFKRPRQEGLRQRIREIARTRVRYGYKRIHVLLAREGIHVNHKRVYRLYCEEGLQLRAKRPKRHVSAVHRSEPVKARYPNQYWSMDFVSDQLINGERFRALTVVDIYTRECLAITPGKNLKSENVVQTLKDIAQKRALPKGILCDNGSEFSGRLTDFWAYQNKVKLRFSRPGKPTDNAFIESFNGSLRDECLNTHWFSSVEDAKLKLEAWRLDYNENRPHRSLNNQTPNEYAAQMAA